MIKEDQRYILEILLNDYNNGGYKTGEEKERYFRLKKIFSIPVNPLMLLIRFSII